VRSLTVAGVIPRRDRHWQGLLHARFTNRVRPMGRSSHLCTAIPEGLIEAELFGYADGALPGPVKEAPKARSSWPTAGVILDEIGDIRLRWQSRLLRVRKSARSCARGDRNTVDSCYKATHHRLEQLSEQRVFREDLFYRLNGFTLS